MKLKRLLSLAMLGIVGTGSSWADTELLTTGNGWQKVTDLSTLTLSDYYFAFVDNDKNLMLSFEEGQNQTSTVAGRKTMVYRTGAKAEMTPAMLWVIDETPDNAMIRNVTSGYYLQCETNWSASPSQLQPWYCHTNDVISNTSGGESWARWKFAYADGAWTIENLKAGNQFIGPWNDGAFSNGREVAANKTGSNVGHFQIYAIERSKVDWNAQATLANPANVSYKIANANAGFNGTTGWTAAGTNVEFGRNKNVGFDGVEGFFEPSKWGSDTGYSFDVTQTISDLPAGKYVVRAAGQNSSGNKLTLNCGGASTFTYPSGGDINGTIDQTGATVAVGSGVAGWVWGEASHYLSANGSLTITFHSEATTKTQWANYDNVELYYYGNGIEITAEEKAPAVLFDTEAGAWYKIPVTTAADYVFTVGDGSCLTYVQDGTKSADAVSGTEVASGDDIALTAGYVYVKTAAATTLRMDVRTFIYDLGALAQSVGDGAFIQQGVITFTYPSSVTNDNTAVPDLVENAAATVNGATTVLTAVENGFQIDLGTLTETSKTYEITVPAGVYGYTGHATNEAISLTLHTPAIFDGVYYLYNPYNQKYLSRGGGYGTQAIVDEYGIAVKLITDSENKTEIRMFDSNMNLGFDGWVYTDTQGANVRTFHAAATEDGYKFLNTSNSKYLATLNGSVVADAEEGVNLEGTSNVWQLESVDSHLADLQKIDDQQAQAAATAAGLTAESKAALETILAGEEYVARTIAITGTGGDVKENYQGCASSGQESVPLAIFEEETVGNLRPGLYKLSVNAFQRATWLEDVMAAGGARGKVYVYANDARTQLKSVAEEPADVAYSTEDKEYDGKHYPDGKKSANEAFGKGMYLNDVYVYVTADEGQETGTIRFGIKNPTRLGNDDSRGAWTCYNNFTLTYYAEANLDIFYADLSAALESCKPWTENGDYVTSYNSIKTACENKTYTARAEIEAAITNLRAGFKTYSWDNASPEHPYLVEGVISQAEMTDNTPWTGNGRSTDKGQHWSGEASRIYFTQNHENGPARSQTVTIPEVGVYLLKTSVRPVTSGAYAEIKVGEEVNRTSGASGTVGGTIATDGTEYESVEAGIAAGAVFANDNKGYGWTYNKILFATSQANEQKTISINLSNVNNDREADCGGMFLYYVGQQVTEVKDGVQYCYGTFADAQFEVTDAVPVVDAMKATVNGCTITRTNPNGLVYLASGSTTSEGNNVVIGGTCSKLQLADGHPFKATRSFEATEATYTMTAVATMGTRAYGTLMLPFAVSNLPGKAYSLDMGVAFGSEIRATGVNAIAANAPVLVTAQGAYTAQNVSVAATADSYENGELVGTYKAMTAVSDSYVLQKHGERVAFYHVGETQPVLNPFRAYIKPQSSQVKALEVLFDDEATAVGGLSAKAQQGMDLYDLSGRKVVKAQKGIYILNDKKIIK